MKGQLLRLVKKLDGLLIDFVDVIDYFIESIVIIQGSTHMGFYQCFKVLFGFAIILFIKRSLVLFGNFDQVLEHGIGDFEIVIILLKAHIFKLLLIVFQVTENKFTM